MNNKISFIIMAPFLKTRLNVKRKPRYIFCSSKNNEANKQDTNLKVTAIIKIMNDNEKSF